MKASGQQIPLDLSTRPDFTAQSFMAGASNAEALNRLGVIEGQAHLGDVQENWANHTLALIGPAGAGKTHLGTLYAAQYDALSFEGADTPAPHVAWKDRHIWIDRASRADEFTLFSLINMAIRGDILSLLLSDTQAPVHWDVEIPDLASRLRNVQHVSLLEPDDVLLFDIVGKMFNDCGLVVDPNVIEYMLNNTGRSVNGLRQWVQKIDHHSQLSKANVTRVFVSKLMQNTP